MKNPLETQQTRARKEFKALGRAEKNGITENDIVQEMVKDMSNPNSAKSLLEAAAAVMYMQSVKAGETPIKDAVDRCLAEKREAQPSDGLVPDPS